MCAHHKIMIFVTLLGTPFIDTSSGQTSDIRSAITDLKSDSDQRRIRAMQFLVGLGKNAIPALARSLEDQDPVMRAAIASVVGQIGDADAADVLIGLLQDKNSGVRQATARSLGTIKNDHAIIALINALTIDNDWRVRMYCARSLGQLHARDAIYPLLRLVEDASRFADERLVGALALAQLKAVEAKDIFVKLLSNENNEPSFLSAIISALGDIGDDSTADYLVRMLDSKRDERVRYNAVAALGKLRSQRVAKPLIRVFNDSSEIEAIRVAAIHALGEIGGEEAILALRTELYKEDHYLAMCAAQALVSLRDVDALQGIVALLVRADDDYIKRVLQEGLRQLSQNPKQ